MTQMFYALDCFSMDATDCADTLADVKRSDTGIKSN